MKVNKYKIILYGFGVLLFVVINYFAGKDNKNQSRIFYDTDIQGKISKMTPRKGGLNITVNNKTFTFIPTFVDDKTEFQFFANVGDSVSKPANSDTLKLVHNGKTYPYTFTKL